MNYETGDVPAHLRDVFNKCQSCGATWIGVSKAVCSECEERAATVLLAKKLLREGDGLRKLCQYCGTVHNLEVCPVCESRIEGETK